MNQNKPGNATCFSKRGLLNFPLKPELPYYIPMVNMDQTTKIKVLCPAIKFCTPSAVLGG